MDMFNLVDLCAGDEDSMLSEFDARLEPQMRSRSYTWPTQPVADGASSAGSEASPGVMPVAGPRLLPAEDGERGSRGELQLSPGGVGASRKVLLLFSVDCYRQLYRRLLKVAKCYKNTEIWTKSYQKQVMIYGQGSKPWMLDCLVCK